MSDLPMVPEHPSRKKKSVFKSPVAPFLGWLLSWLYRGWCSTLRYELIGYNFLQEQNDSGQPVVVAIWHNEIFPLIYCRGKLRLAAMVSQSKDGEILAMLLKRLGIRPLRGSSSRGGVRALLGAKKAIQEQSATVCVTVDGPRGPRHKAKDGAIYLAQMAEAPILPVRIYIPEAKVFRRAWDHFRLPLPFSRITVVFGEPYKVPSEPLDENALVAERDKILAKMQALLPENIPPGKENLAQLIPGAKIQYGNPNKKLTTKRTHASRIARGLEYLLSLPVYIVTGCVGRLGIDWSRRLGNGLGVVLWLIMPKRRALALRNIKQHLQVSDSEAERIARASFKHTARSFFELCLVGNFNKLWADGRIAINDEKLFEDLKADKNAVVASTASGLNDAVGDISQPEPGSHYSRVAKVV